MVVVVDISETNSLLTHTHTQNNRYLLVTNPYIWPLEKEIERDEIYRKEA